ncbi:Helix-turn-helix [Ruminococcus sp. YE71]|uniref:helix-turn-helix domain-containing protein n=1 Tax=unclassified Ruminococcus TaxID=2608920 RepID=UPI00088471C1|nr:MULTISPECIES: helix-turn-helix transcriptional regulator [unclassified Ruminococcus]SDA11481.1 Helix-turn-helix [Ruminococcus sp. YE78]SFW15291.1 Helix-turn-helix [Ruminococcus sp. YE71]
MKVYEAVATRIQELCEQKNMTVNGLANISGLSPSTVKSIIYGASKNPGVATIKILCDGLEISLVEFFDADVFRELEQEIE